jgi:glycosyltransferase involved in cell wall biosynthesis
MPDACEGCHASLDYMNTSPDLSIVLPIYNEAGALPGLHAELTAVLAALGKRYEIIAVDDGSRDESLAVLKRLAQADPHLTAISLRRNFGQTAAFAAGFNHARGSIVVTLDADGQNDPADIPTILAKLDEGYDIVSGWRRNRQEPFLSRKLPSAVANWLISHTTDVRLHDYGCSLKVYRSDVVKNVRLYGDLHRYIPALASWMGVRIAEVPVNDRGRQHGRSKYGIGRTPRVLFDLLTVCFMLSYGARPMQLFGLLGLASFGAGTLFGLYLTALKVFYRVSLSNRPLLWLAVLLIVIGVQFISLGLIAEMLTRTYHETQNKTIYAVREIIGPGEGSGFPQV